MHIEHFLQPVRCVGVQIRLKSTSSLCIQIVVLLDQSLKFILNIYELIIREFVMVQLHFSMHQMFQVALFLWQ